MKAVHHSLRFITILGSILLVFLVFSLVAGFLVYSQQRSVVVSFQRTVNLTADKKALELDSCFSTIENAVSAAQEYILRTLDEDRLQEDPLYEQAYMDSLSKELISLARFPKGLVALYFRMEIERFGGDKGVFLESNSKGSFVNVKPTDLSLYSPTDMEHVGWYYIPVWARRPVWTAPYENRNINTYMISYIIPLYRGETLLGIVGMDVNLAVLKDIVDSQPEEEVLGILLGQEDDLVYYSNSGGMEKSVERSSDARMLMGVLRHSDSTEPKDFRWMNDTYRGVQRKLSNGMTLVISLNTRALRLIWRKIALSLLLAFSVICVFLILYIYFQLAVLISPIRVISRASYKLARGELNIRIPYKSENELGLLADNIRKMTTQMKEYISYIREQTLRERAEKEHALTESQSKSKFLASMYVSLHEIDLNEDSFTEVHSRPDIAEVVNRTIGNARETVHRVMEERVQDRDGCDKEDFMRFIDFDTLDERMKDRITVAHEFYSVMNYWCRARFILIDRNPDGTLHHVLWAVENIDKERGERETLRSEAERNAAASQAKSAFLANMSHEIRTPINAVLGMDEMILRESEDEAIKGYAANIKMAGTNLLSIVNDILDFSKIEAGKMELLPDSYDVSSMVIDLVNMIQTRAQGKGLAFVLNADPALPKSLWGDSVRIKQVILNLLTNAVKYTKAGSVTFGISCSKKNEEVVLLKVHVKDTGSGIKPENMEKLFSPFERIEEGKNKTIEGSGLGMSIVTKLLAMMGSQLQVESEYGKGSDFAFELEQKVVDWTPVGDIEEVYHASIARMSAYTEKLHAPRARLLFVDDTLMNLEVIKGLLKKTGIQIDTALSGMEALNLVRENEYDILFLDHRMPEMDGIQTLHAMQNMQDNRSAGKPCIALTANVLSGVKKMYLDEGFDDYLSKPVNPDKLEDLIRFYLPPDYLEAPPDDEEPDKEAGGGILPRLEGIDGIDVGSALANCGTEELLESTVRIYVSSLPDRIAELEGLCAASDWKNYGVKVHAMKSTSRLVGAVELSALAAELEALADRRAGDEIRIGHEKLVTGLKALGSALEQLVMPAEESDSGSKPLLSGAELEEKLSRLADCAESFDIDGLDSIVSELAAYSFQPEFEETLKKIRTCVENVNFKGLKATLSAWKDGT